MGSGKSIEILKVAHNYESQGKKVLLMTPDVDDRSGVGVIYSRIGLKRKAAAIAKDENIYQKVLKNHENLAAVLIDEAQFLQPEQVDQLARIVDELNIPVMTFGLRQDAFNQLFPGSKRLFEIADKLEEMKTICTFCGKKAITQLRVVDGKPQYTGDQVFIGGNESYVPVCRKHWYHPDMKRIEHLFSN